jgi:hypothetical protein
MMNFGTVLREQIMAPSDHGKDDVEETYHPSSSGYCLRQMLLSKIKKKEFTYVDRGGLLIGTILHEWIQSKVEKEGIIEQKIKLNVPDSNLHFLGSVDFLHNVDKEPYDFKTTSNLYYVKKAGKPSVEHKYQLNLYMEAVGAQKGYIVYMDKRNLQHIQFGIKRNPAILEEIYAKTKEIHKAYLEYKETKIIKYDKCGCWLCKREKNED